MGEGIRTLLLHADLPSSFWAEALRQVVWVKVRTVHAALPGGKTPFEAWSGRKPDVSMARVSGCMGSVRLNTSEQDGKLAPRGAMCVCLGVDEEAKGWRMFDPEVMKVRLSRDVDFVEHVTWR